MQAECAELRLFSLSGLELDPCTPPLPYFVPNITNLPLGLFSSVNLTHYSGVNAEAKTAMVKHVAAMVAAAGSLIHFKKAMTLKQQNYSLGLFFAQRMSCMKPTSI